jgi:hypothetical protein
LQRLAASGVKLFLGGALAAWPQRISSKAWQGMVLPGPAHQSMAVQISGETRRLKDKQRAGILDEKQGG